MFTPEPRLSVRMYSAMEVATYLGISYNTLSKHRCYGTGPRFLKLGGKVVYRIEDVLDWVKGGFKHATTEGDPHCLAAIKRKSPDLRPYAGKLSRKKPSRLA